MIHHWFHFIFMLCSHHYNEIILIDLIAILTNSVCMIHDYFTSVWINQQIYQGSCSMEHHWNWVNKIFTNYNLKSNDTKDNRQDQIFLKNYWTEDFVQFCCQVKNFLMIVHKLLYICIIYDCSKNFKMSTNVDAASEKECVDNGLYKNEK